MFAITNAAEFFAKVKDDLAALEEKIDDSGRAMNCILSAFHLHEWVGPLAESDGAQNARKCDDQR